MSWPALIADIGGTNARFAIIGQAGAKPAHARNLMNADYPSLAEAITAYCAMEGVRPKRAAIAAAGPQKDGMFRLTNRTQWDVPVQSLIGTAGLESVRVLNDFEALALSLPHLRAPDLFAITQTESPEPGAPLCVVGPGTGLGVGAVLRTSSGWQAIPSEGGHVELGHRNGAIATLLDKVRTRFGRVSAERVLCGTGLALLHELRSGQKLSPEEVGEQAIAENGAARATAIDFLSILASLAGDMALVYGARGGVFIGGGIITRLVPLIDKESFAADFRAKGRLEPYLGPVPLSVITNPVPALIGCAASLEAQA